MAEVNSPGIKRRLDLTDDTPRARKRLVAACFTCRTRKIRCNKERPVCSSCISSRTECIYEPDPDALVLDRASQLILDELGDISNKLDKLSSSTVVSQSSHLSNQTQHRPGHAPHLSPPDLEEEEEEDGSALPNWPPARAGPDAITTWPIFGAGFKDRSFVNVLFDKYVLNDEDPEASYSAVNAAEAECLITDVPTLTSRFIRFVHIKNPMLDIQSLMDDVNAIVKTGLRWNAASCLVLLVCALGALAAPFPQASQRATPTTVSSTPGAREFDLANNFHALAQRRFGLLRGGVVKSQCYVLSAIFHMYMVRPVEAWSDFASASQNLYLYLQARHRQADQSGTNLNGSTPMALQLEQRVYWTCIKSECELREHLTLPALPLHQIRYPYLFPAPPDPMFQNTPRGVASSNDALTIDEDQQSWFYYLTEVSLRRIRNQIFTSFYSQSSDAWQRMNVEKMQLLAQRFEEQLEEWRSSTPESIGFDNAIAPTDEIRYMTRARYIYTLSLLWIPFLYYVIHAQDPTTHDVISCRPYAAKVLEICTNDTGGEIAERHRHHGTWFGCMRQITDSLLLIAGQISGRIQMPPNWQKTISEALSVLDYWQYASPDIAKGKSMIEMLCRKHEIL